MESKGADTLRETFYTFPAPARIALVSDLHDRPFADVQKSLARQKPELILIAGDLFYHRLQADGRSILYSSPYVLPFLRACAQVAPSFFSLGNHDWMLTQADYEIIRDAGVTVLDNSWTEHDGIRIGGLTSASVTRYRKEGVVNRKKSIFRHRFLGKIDDPVPELAWLADFTAFDGYKILLSHHPEYWEKYLREKPIDLIVSGHAHGGQIRLFGQGLYAPGQGWFPKYTSGVHGNMIISRGLANTGGIIPRLFNERETVYIGK